jgi:hypothetical protein
MNRLRATIALATALLALALPAAAGADWQQVVQDCADDGKLDRQYQPGELSDADKRMPTDIREYTDCEAVIAAARRNGGSGSSNGPGADGGTGGSGGAPGGDPAAKTPSGAQGGSAADVAALKTDTESARRSKPSIQAGGQPVAPASSGLDDVAGAANALPASLIVAIALLAGLCAVGGAVAGRRRLPALVRAPLRLVRR